MKRSIIFAVIALIFFAQYFSMNAQTTANDGDWSAQQVILRHTQEAELMIRVGDIDNLNFGWESEFNPFLGRPTSVHSYPWEPKKNDIPGMDRIMISTSQGKVKRDCSNDGYSLAGKLAFRATPITVPLQQAKGMNITGAILTMFIDDFQAPDFCGKYRVWVNKKRFTDIEKVINLLRQGGPIGKFISVRFPQELLSVFQADKLSIMIDDSTTGAFDGYAIDFVKVLVNPKDLLYKGGILGEIRDEETQSPIQGAVTEIRGYTTVETNQDGVFTMNDVPIGLHVVEASARGYENNSIICDIIADETQESPVIYLRKTKPVVYEGKQLQSGDAITLKNIQFSIASSELTAEAKKELQSIVTLMKNNERIEIELSGHTSSEGQTESNRLLSLSRVMSCKRYVVSQGIDESRIVTQGYGSDKPIAPNDSEQNRTLNRRVEMKIVKM